MAENVVLLVEDNPADVKLALLAFKDIGFRHKVIVARDGQEAVDYLFATGAHAGRDKRQTPVLVLLDLKLPKIDGLEVLKRVRGDSVLKHVIVAVLTSSGEVSDRLAAMDLGANLFLRKALDYEDFLKIVRSVDRLTAALTS